MTGKNSMANVYVEARPKGCPEGERIDDYVVEDHADHVLRRSRLRPRAKTTVPWSLESGI
jgi:hypothetical protein